MLTEAASTCNRWSQVYLACPGSRADPCYQASSGESACLLPYQSQNSGQFPPLKGGCSGPCRRLLSPEATAREAFSTGPGPCQLDVHSCQRTLRSTPFVPVRVYCYQYQPGSAVTASRVYGRGTIVYASFSQSRLPCSTDACRPAYSYLPTPANNSLDFTVAMAS
jgi:hypothetical protein